MNAIMFNNNIHIIYILFYGFAITKEKCHNPFTIVELLMITVLEFVILIFYRGNNWDQKKII